MSSAGIKCAPGPSCHRTTGSNHSGSSGDRASTSEVSVLYLSECSRRRFILTSKGRRYHGHWLIRGWAPSVVNTEILCVIAEGSLALKSKQLRPRGGQLLPEVTQQCLARKTVAFLGDMKVSVVSSFPLLFHPCLSRTISSFPVCR